MFNIGYVKHKLIKKATYLHFCHISANVTCLMNATQDSGTNFVCCLRLE